MAIERRNNIYNRAIGGQGIGGPRRGKGFGGGGGFAGPGSGIREIPQMEEPYVPGGTEEYGATDTSTQPGISGHQASLPTFNFDMIGYSAGNTLADWMNAHFGAESMQDIYDMWAAGTFEGEFHGPNNYLQTWHLNNPNMGSENFDSFDDWYDAMTGAMNFAWGDWGTSNPGLQWMQGLEGWGGDLGTGTMFGEPELDCDFMGPQYDNAGNCYACCPASDYEFGEIDPATADCNSLYAQAGGFDMTQLTLSEFSALYC